MLHSHVFEWCKRYKGCKNLDKDPKNRRPTTSRTTVNIESVREMVCRDRQQTDELMANGLGMNQDSVWKTLTEDLDM